MLENHLRWKVCYMICLLWVSIYRLREQRRKEESFINKLVLMKSGGEYNLNRGKESEKLLCVILKAETTRK